MRQTIQTVALFLLLFLGLSGIAVAMPRNDYGDCNGNCEQRLEAASLRCLAETIYYEAGNQPTEGKIAVAFVVLNRAWKNHLTTCEVVQKPRQFCWVSNEKLRRRAKNQIQWTECQDLAAAMLYYPEFFEDPTHGATAFRRPIDCHFPVAWIATIRIGGHIFYRQP
jgi:spore germination cell wall hydrolase CwlJ-like protein